MIRRWKATVYWYAETPDDDMAADNLADTFTDDVESAINGMPGIEPGSARVDDLDTVENEETE